MRLCDIFTLFFFMMASRQTAPHPCSCLKKRTSAISAARMGFGVGHGLPGTGKQPSRLYRRNSSLAQRLVMPCCLATCQTGRSPFCSSLIIHETLRLLSFLMYKSILRRNLIRDKTKTGQKRKNKKPQRLFVDGWPWILLPVYHLIPRTGHRPKKK